MFGWQFPVFRFRTKRFLTAIAHFQHSLVEIVGFIASLSLILEGWFTIYFNSNFVEKKKWGETFSTDKWFKIYGYNIGTLTVLWDTL